LPDIGQVVDPWTLSSPGIDRWALRTGDYEFSRALIAQCSMLDAQCLGARVIHRIGGIQVQFH